MATSFSYLVSAATTNSTNVKNAAGKVYGYEIGNNGAGDCYVKLYDKASAPTVGTDVPVRVIYVPKGQRVAAVCGDGDGLLFLNGIGFGITGALVATDTTAVALNQVCVSIEYR